ncbi:MAG: ectoine/hydroxyectoine ABC transporter permease subunit EhuC [Nocardioidaceae bacterium]
MTDLNALLEWVPNLVRGLQLTLLATILGSLLMGVVALVLGLMARSHKLLVRGFARTVIEFFRGTSLLVQLFWFFYALPLLGLLLDPLLAGVLALGFNYGAYGAEIVRGSINAVPATQWEAATALNLSPARRMRRVIWPQAVALMIPAFNNLFIQLLKSTPLLYSITLLDLMNYGDAFRLNGGDAGLIYVVLLLIYFVMTYAFTFLFTIAEVRANKRLGRHEGFASIFKSQRVTREPDQGVGAGV